MSKPSDLQRLAALRRLSTELLSLQYRLNGTIDEMVTLLQDYYLAGLRDVLRLTDVAPYDLLYDVRFRHVADGAVHGTVIDRHRTGLRTAFS